jgi:hypothetical protein
MVLLAVLRVEDDGVAPTGLHIQFGAFDDAAFRPEPFGQVRRFRPRRVDFFGRGIETTFEGEAWVDGGAGGGYGHVSSSTKLQGGRVEQS